MADGKPKINITDDDVAYVTNQVLEGLAGAQKKMQPTPPFYSKLSELGLDEAWGTNLKLIDVLQLLGAFRHQEEMHQDARFYNNQLRNQALARSDDSIHYAGLQKANAAARYGRDLDSTKERGDLAYDREWNIDEVARLVAHSDELKTVVLNAVALLFTKMAAKAGEGDPETVPGDLNIPGTGTGASRKTTRRPSKRRGR